jgi:hypothetical protein
MRNSSIGAAALCGIALLAATILVPPAQATPTGPSPGFLLMGGDGAQSLYGKGRYDSFLRFDNRFALEGFNTDYRGNGRAPLDAIRAPGGNHSLRLGSLETVSIEGAEYYAFRLDLHGPASAPFDDLTLDALRLYVADRGDVESLGTLAVEGDLRWDLDAMGVARMDLRSALLEPGAGRYRADFLIPKSAFEGVDPSKYLYLYSRFGAASGVEGGVQGHGAALGGFEEWHAYVRPAVDATEPSTLLLLGSGIVVMVLMRKRQRS